MIVIENEWKDIGYDVLETNGKWVYEQFYGPICEFGIQKYDENRVGITPLAVHVEGTNSMTDFNLLCLMTKEFLEAYSEVALTIPKLKRICRFTYKDNVEEILTGFLKNAPLI